MFQGLISNLLKSIKGGENASSSKKTSFGLDNLNDDVIGCLTDPAGISVVQPTVLQERMDRDIRVLRNEMGLKPEEFNEYLLPVFVAFIRYADLLPASQTKHHSTTGGLLFHSFDVAKRAMRAAQCTQFPIGLGTLADTQQSNKQWRVATVLAALLHDGGKILADMIVSNGENGDTRSVWNAHGELSIYEWAHYNRIERYYVSWQRERYQKHQNASLMVMQKLIPQQTWSWIDACYDGKQIHAAMLNAVMKSSIDHPMTNIVAQTDSDSVTHDMFNRTTHISKEVTQVPISDLLANLIKHYILKGRWDVNKKDAPIWFVNNTLYIVWSSAAPELVQEIRGVGKKIPESPDLLANIMIEDGLALKNDKDIYFEIYPEILGDAKKPVRIKALKVRHIQTFVLEEETLYSIKEHPKKQGNKDKKTLGKPVEVQFDSPEPTESPRIPSTSSTIETSLGTLNRVLVHMKNQQPNKPIDHQSVTSNTTEVTENSFEAEADDDPTMNNGIENYNPNDEMEDLEYEDHYQSPDRTTQQQAERADTQESEADKLLAFIKDSFDFPVHEGKVLLTERDVKAIAQKVTLGNFEGINMFNAQLKIRRLTEVEING